MSSRTLQTPADWVLPIDIIEFRADTLARNGVILVADKVLLPTSN